ncbi:hypothetical protein PG991_004606 [Apiospora marii]|uniref:Uncharacterized protein n=1 Tax=Apiospora marii TaxID=335849 RepID=A0ABR1S6U2_9PEZI
MTRLLHVLLAGSLVQVGLAVPAAADDPTTPPVVPVVPLPTLSLPTLSLPTLSLPTLSLPPVVVPTGKGKGFPTGKGKGFPTGKGKVTPTGKGKTTLEKRQAPTGKGSAPPPPPTGKGKGPTPTGLVDLPSISPPTINLSPLLNADTTKQPCSKASAPPPVVPTGKATPTGAPVVPTGKRF